MELSHLKNSFVKLGKALENLEEEEKENLFVKTSYENGWFTRESLETGLKGLLNYLDKNKLNEWVNKYDLPAKNSKSIGIVMAGNIPFVGFHDLLCVLISGHSAVIKPSSKDKITLEFIIEKLLEIEPKFKSRISLVERLNSFDAVIATGSDNSSRYFDYYFSKYPHIIRKNRTSVAILDGSESLNDLQKLSDDIFQYYGLGCRNVSKIYIPRDFQIESIFKNFEGYNTLPDNHKYANNYNYQKSIALVNQERHFDLGYALVKENNELVSPVAVIYYERYQNRDDLETKLDLNKEKIQCIVSANKLVKNSIPMGKTQQPELWDYTDHIDTMKFLTGLN